MKEVPERYMEDDDKLRPKLVRSCEIITEREIDVEDNEETKAYILHERFAF